MEPVTIGIIGILGLFVLLALGLSVGTALAMLGFLGFWAIVGQNAALSRMAIIPYETVSSYGLAVLPLFILMANVIFMAGFGTDAYTLAARCIGHFRGGLAMATVAGCAMFAAMSASSLATIVTMGYLAFPEMKKYNYDLRLSSGAVAAGGTIGILIPPSGMLILYGVLTETSIGKLFLGGMIPGILEALFYIIMLSIWCSFEPNIGPPGPKFTWKQRLQAFLNCWEMIGLIFLVLGGLIIGWFTPTEAGAVGAMGSILFSAFRRRLSWADFKTAAQETVKNTGLLYVVMIGAFVYKYFISVSNIPMILADYVSTLAVPPLVIMSAILFCYIILGCFMDAMAMILLTIPIFLPVCEQFGFSSIWFGIIITRSVELAAITPPLGINLFTIGTMFNVPVLTVTRGVVWFICADVVHMFMLLFFPITVMFLPNLL
ncbi:TRAP transporter large permease [Thermodesulfobacteriota bacterium]